MKYPRWADFEAWANLRRENRAYLAPWEPSWNEGQLNRTAFRSRLASYKTLVSDDSAYPFHVFRSADDELVGACNLTLIQRGVRQSANIGYWVGEDFARQGFARAAVGASLRFAFSSLGLHRVQACVQAENTASIRVLETSGFIAEGTARGGLKINGKWQDHLVYAKLSSD